MNTCEPKQAEADVQVAMDYISKGKPIPPDVARRIQERAAQGSKELFELRGIQNSGVQIIREIRGELPNS